ncbi:MAG TPA: hypothetical protein VL490_05740, partial [Mucilaginibacter sp.]|nr:hypothetical protein [Mucilaginibacter sp.]
MAALQSCKQKTKPAAPLETDISGTAKFVIDESFQPIVDEEATVFKNFYPKAKPEFMYKPENSALR